MRLALKCVQYLHIHAPVILFVILFACRWHYGWVGDPCRMHAWGAQHQRVREPGGGGKKTGGEWQRVKESFLEKCIVSGDGEDSERQSKSESLSKQWAWKRKKPLRWSFELFSPLTENRSVYSSSCLQWLKIKFIIQIVSKHRNPACVNKKLKNTQLVAGVNVEHGT